MSSADTPHAPYDSDDPDGKEFQSHISIIFSLSFLVYRQQLRDKALPVSRSHSHINCIIKSFHF
mgnify:FL=1